MDRSEQFKNVEQVLACFPKDAQENYYKNKETLVIDTVDNLSISAEGVYDSEYNTIKLIDTTALEHELFHMSFNNRTKYLKEIIPGIYLDNGVCYHKNNSTYGLGLTEGFAESLAKKAKAKCYSRQFQCYIVNLLISIYGDSLYVFPLKNDPIGFYDYCSENIHDVSRYLDLYTKVFEFIGDIFKIKDNLNKSSYDSKFSKIIAYVGEYIPISAIGCIRSLVAEYNSCLFPKVTKLEFKNQLEEMLLIEEIILINSLFGIDLKQEIDNIINTELMTKKYIKE